LYLRLQKLILILLLAIFASSFSTAYLMTTTSFNPLAIFSLKGGNDNFNKFSDKLHYAYNFIKNNYIKKVDDQKLIDGAISGMVSSLGDPYSTYMDKKTALQFKERLESSFSGIGAEVTIRNGRLTVIAPFKGSPAEKAGILPQDQIIKVDGKSIEGLNINEAVSKIKGPKGTKVNLEIVRPGYSNVLNIMVVRDEIPLRTVEARLDENKIGIITISLFSEKTADDFKKELLLLEKKGLKGLIIDVRNNPGGLFPVVLKIADELIGKEKVLLYTEDNHGRKVKYVAKKHNAKEYPIVCLINHGSASASEILAAALKEAGNYKLVGERTFGKGTVQSTENFSDGSNLKLTMAKWLTPKGNWIDQKGTIKGIKPDFEVKKPLYLDILPPQGIKILRKDQTSEEIKRLQIILNVLGFSTGRTDGYFDIHTETALKEFQKINKLPITGYFDLSSAVKLKQSFLKFLLNKNNDVQLNFARNLLKKQITREEISFRN